MESLIGSPFPVSPAQPHFLENVIDVSLPVSGPGDAELCKTLQSGVGEGKGSSSIHRPLLGCQADADAHAQGFRWLSCAGGGLGPDGFHLLLRALSMSADMAGVRVTSRGRAPRLSVRKTNEPAARLCPGPAPPRACGANRETHHCVGLASSPLAFRG